MAKRMKFSVVGLPHYTIWHLYEPSVDDIRHMEEMEKERKAREAEEKAKKERQDKISSTFDTSGKEWEKDKESVNSLKQKAAEEDQAAQKDVAEKKEKSAQEEAAEQKGKAIQKEAAGKKSSEAKKADTKKVKVVDDEGEIDEAQRKKK